jgi:S-adenosylmethionine decarboxylase
VFNRAQALHWEGAEMARLEHGVAAIGGAKALKPHALARTVPVPIPFGDADKVHFTVVNGFTIVGKHRIMDFVGCRETLDDTALMQIQIEAAAKAAGATLLSIHLHKFGDGGGVTGVAVLAESHISVHTWPELGYAAFDAFMCGATEPKKAQEVLEAAFKPSKIIATEISRGPL